MDETGRHAVLISRRGEQALNETTREMTNFRDNLTLNDPRLIEALPEFPGDMTVVIQTIFPNVIVQQQSNTLAMRQLVSGAGSLQDEAAAERDSSFEQDLVARLVGARAGRGEVGLGGDRVGR